jgi:hypothetical protein
MSSLDIVRGVGVVRKVRGQALDVDRKVCGGVALNKL